ncbi:MAG: histidine kinase [Chitinophagaceae bacterium]|nr:histidine kinase [Chitinophagaceae bacterium]
MKLFRPPKLELYSFLFSMPLISIAVNQILYNNRLWHDHRIWLLSFPLIFLIGALSWYSHTCYDNWVERKFPALNQSRQRIFLKCMVLFLVMTPSILLIFFVYDRFSILGYQLQTAHLYKGFITGFSVNLVFETLYEADYILGKYKESKTEKETIHQLSVAEEYDNLKSQVNPHFLFNCFNTLSSLISIDKKKAEIFLDELSKVYRYLLRSNEEGISTVDNEIKFIQSYFKLLKTRHGEAVQLNIQTDQQLDGYLVPSLSLQLLVENVVKHNALSKSNPLVIDIFTTAGKKLVVSNNRQCLSVKAPGNKVGLQNIKAKYELLNQQGFQVIEDEKNFTVVLPLIWKPPVTITEKEKKHSIKNTK